MAANLEHRWSLILPGSRSSFFQSCNESPHFFIYLLVLLKFSYSGNTRIVQHETSPVIKFAKERRAFSVFSDRFGSRRNSFGPWSWPSSKRTTVSAESKVARFCITYPARPFELSPFLIYIPTASCCFYLRLSFLQAIFLW